MSTDSTKDALIAAAKKVFAQKGFDGATVKEVAELAGANISLVSYHFQGKEGLFRTCIQEFGEARLTATERILRPVESAEDFRIRLTLFVEEFIGEILREPDVSAILHRECGAMNNPIVQEVFQATFIKIFDLLIRFFEGAQQKGVISKDIDAHAVSLIFIGGMVHTTQMDPMHEKLYGTSLKSEKYRQLIIDTTIRVIMDGIVPPKNSNPTP